MLFKMEKEDLEAAESEAAVEEEKSESVGSSLTMVKVAAAKKFIENHYRTHRRNIEDRKERYRLILFLSLF